MKIKKLEWEEKIINEYYTDKKYTSNKIKIGLRKLTFVIDYNVYNDGYSEYILRCFVDKSDDDVFVRIYDTLEEAKEAAEEYYLNTMIGLIQSLNENIDQFEDTDEDVINVLLNILKNATFK